MPTLWLLFALIAVLLAIWIALMVRASARGRGRVLFGIFLLAVASLPVWGAILSLVLGSFQSRSPEYWAAAPWLLLAAFFEHSGVFQHSGLSVLIALSTAVVYSGTPGDNSRKLKNSLICFFLLSVCAAAFIGVQLKHARQEAVDRRTESAVVAGFVEHDSEVAKELTGPIIARVISVRSRGLRRPLQYVVLAHEESNMTNGVRVVVGVSRTERGTQFHIACISPKDTGWSESNPCEPVIVTEPRRR